jgi:hypothetical protein
MLASSSVFTIVATAFIVPTSSTLTASQQQISSDTAAGAFHRTSSNLRLQLAAAPATDASDDDDSRTGALQAGDPVLSVGTIINDSTISKLRQLESMQFVLYCFVINRYQSES